MSTLFPAEQCLYFQLISVFFVLCYTTTWSLLWLHLLLLLLHCLRGKPPHPPAGSTLLLLPNHVLLWVWAAHELAAASLDVFFSHWHYAQPHLPVCAPPE